MRAISCCEELHAGSRVDAETWVAQPLVDRLASAVVPLVVTRLQLVFNIHPDGALDLQADTAVNTYYSFEMNEGDRTTTSEPSDPGADSKSVKVIFWFVLYFILPIYPFSLKRFKKRFDSKNGDVTLACKSTIERWQVYVIVSALLATVTFPVIATTDTSATCPKHASCDDPCHEMSDPIKQTYVMLSALSFLAASFCALTYMYQLLHYSALDSETDCLPAQNESIISQLWMLDILAFLSFHIAFTTCNIAVVVAAIGFLDLGFRIAIAAAGGIIILLGVICRVIFLSAFDLQPKRLW